MQITRLMAIAEKHAQVADESRLSQEAAHAQQLALKGLGYLGRALRELNQSLNENQTRSDQLDRATTWLVFQTYLEDIKFGAQSLSALLREIIIGKLPTVFQCAMQEHNSEMYLLAGSDDE